MMKKLAYLSVFTSLIGASIISINFGAFQLSVFRIIVVLMTFGMVLILLGRDKKNLAIINNKNSYSIKFMIIWLIYSIISISWVNDYQGWIKAIYFLSIGVLCILIYSMTFKTDKEILKSLEIMSLMILFHNLIGWYEILTGNYLFLTNSEAYYVQYKLPTSMFGNTNDFATFMLISIWILIICIINCRFKLIKIGYSIITVSSIILLIMTTSRANLLGLILSVLVFLYLSMKKNRGRKTAISILIIIFLVILIMPNLLNNLILMFNNHMQFGLSDDSGSDFIRKNLMKNGIQFLINTFGFGTGAGNIEYWMSNYGKYYTYGVTNIHNWWMEILTGYGILIFTLYVIFYVSIIKSLYKIYKNSKNRIEVYISLCFICSMSGFIIGSISSSSNISREWLWVFWALIISFQGISTFQESSNIKLSITNVKGGKAD